MFRFLALSLVVISFAFAGCPEVVTSRTSLEDPPGVEPGDPEVLAMPAMRAESRDRFVTSTACAMCHSNHRDATAMRDEQNREIAPFNLWQGTMMANASRDPLWRAMVTAEMKQSPGAAAAIEAKCMRCHAPMASEAARARDSEPSMADLTTSGGLEMLAGDGVSCSVCHQIQPGNLGTEESYSGGFVIGSERKIFGPHQNPAPGPMQNHVNYTPTFAPHVLQANLCATCHNLTTHPVEADGTPIENAVFPEQATYLEWSNSRFNNEDGADGVSCQGCHMPTSSVDGEIIRTRIARAPPGFDFNIQRREPFGRHAFVGANTFMPALMKAERDVLRPQATDAAFDATVELARHRLTELTATVGIEAEKVEEDTLSFAVTVVSDAGHKLPTGFPSRRAWLRVVVRDEDGELLFTSGDFNDEGRIIDLAGDVLDVEKAGGPVEPHHTVITRADEVQIYEQLMADKDGQRTSSLMRAAGHVKDNRILPAGYSTDHPSHAVTKPVGVDGDDDFVAGADRVRYEVALGGKKPASIEVSLVYQSVGGRFARELFQVDTPEVRAFRTMYERANRKPVSVATASKPLK